MATGNMQKKFGENYHCSFRDVQTAGQTYSLQYFTMYCEKENLNFFK